MTVTLKDLSGFSPLAEAAIKTFLDYIWNGEKGRYFDLRHAAEIITDLPGRQRKIAYGLIGRALEGEFFI